MGLHIRFGQWFGVLAILAAFVAGCGGDDDRDADRRKAKTRTQADKRGAVPRAVKPASNCLKKAGYRVVGGSPRRDDKNAPDYELVLSRRDGGAFIAFYDQRSRAKRYEPAIKKNAEQFRGASVERHGAITIVWVRLSDRPRARVRSCLSV